MTQVTTTPDRPAVLLDPSDDVVAVAGRTPPADVPPTDARLASITATPGRLADYATLTKPRITSLVVVTAYIGFALGGYAVAGAWSWLMLAGTLVGTALSCMGASVLNQLYERDTDGLMERTGNRPLPAGRIAPREAAWLGVLLSAAGVAALWLTTNSLAAAASTFTIVTYTLLYTPMKRVSTLAVWVGAVPGAMPPIIGYAAATGTIGTPAWIAFAIMFVWQIPHFLAIAWLYRDDYARAGLPMLPVVEPDGGSTFRQILATCFALLPLGLLPTLLNVSGMAYFVTAFVCGLLFLACAAALVHRPDRTRARRLFFASLIYLPVVLGAMLIDAV
jgi:protoheme IX farnesyltransferase